MRMRRSVRGGLVMALVAAATAWLSADTLVMRDGRRITGDLVSVRGTVVEFQEWTGRQGRLLKIDRADVRRIEFDEGQGPGGRPGYGPGGRPSGMRERAVSVPGNRQWTDTGLQVEAGQTVYFTARGEITWAPGRTSGPEGGRDMPSNPKWPMPNRPGAALIGRVGTNSADSFYIGTEQGAFRIREAGRLYVGVNDDYLKDNRGGFTVTVYY
jgi:hypothetical protein